MSELDRLRAICLACEGATERLSHGEPSWFVRDKRQFAMYSNHHHGDPNLGVWVAAPLGAQEALIDSNPAVYFRPPYVGPKGWVGIRLDVGADWGEVEAVVQEGFAFIAAKR